MKALLVAASSKRSILCQQKKNDEFKIWLNRKKSKEKKQNNDLIKRLEFLAH